jgi:opacity protein-like surface antigen
MHVQFWLTAALVATLGAGDAFAQVRTWRPEISASAGLAHVFRWDDRAFGDVLSAGGAVAIAGDSGWVLEIHGDRTFGLSAPPAPCGLVNITCSGLGHDGPTSVATLTIGAQYRFGGGRVQPYLLGGVGVMWSRSLHSVTRVRGAVADISEFASRDAGLGPDVGAGLRVALNQRWSFNAEVRWLEASVLARENLGTTRLLTRVTYAMP